MIDELFFFEMQYILHAEMIDKGTSKPDIRVHS